MSIASTMVVEITGLRGSLRARPFTREPEAVPADRSGMARGLATAFFGGKIITPPLYRAEKRIL
jgi:hypothetical protein